MEEQNYVTLSKKIITCIFSNQDIKNVILYLSKNLKARDYIQKMY